MSLLDRQIFRCSHYDKGFEAGKALGVKLARRPSLSLSQINWLIQAAAYGVAPVVPPPALGQDEAAELFQTLRSLRGELNKEDDGGR